MADEKRWDWLKDELSEIKAKQDKQGETLATQATTLALNTESLKEHMRRSDLLEERVEPVEKHVAMVNGVFKAIGALSMVVGLAAGIAKLVSLL